MKGMNTSSHHFLNVALSGHAFARAKYLIGQGVARKQRGPLNLPMIAMGTVPVPVALVHM